MNSEEIRVGIGYENISEWIFMRMRRFQKGFRWVTVIPMDFQVDGSQCHHIFKEGIFEVAFFLGFAVTWE